MAVRQRSNLSTLAEQVAERHDNVQQDLAKISLDEPPPRLFLSTGCALLNLAISDRVDGGWPGGRISNLIGDSDTGKTVLALSALAEACINPAFADHRLLYLDLEAVLTTRMIESMFGSKLASRLEIMQSGTDGCPETIEELHYLLLRLFKEGHNFVLPVDSFDALPSRQELEETNKSFAAWKKNKDHSGDSEESEGKEQKPLKGSYQMSKQKYSKKMFREVKGLISNTDSLLLIVSQTIANIGSMFNPKTVAGGNALEFFSRIRGWLSVAEADKVNGRIVGRRIKFRGSKNHITGKKRDASLWVYDGLGVDDLKTSVEYLVAESVWPKNKGWIDALHLGVRFQVRDLIKYIEANRLELKLQELMQQTWDASEAALKPQRKPRYE